MSTGRRPFNLFEAALMEPPEDHTEPLHQRVERECWKGHGDNFEVCQQPACVLLKRVARACGWAVEMNGVRPLA